jgi:FkbM family methyltransferase
MRFDYSPPWSERGQTAVVDIDGFSPDDAIAKEIDEHRTFYEIDLLEHIGMSGPRGGVYIDGGANIGNHSIYFGRFLADHVLAVEPHPLLVPLLARNLRVNNLDNVSILPLALGAEPGLGRMVLRTPHAVKKNIGGSQVAPLGAESGTSERPETVPITTLDRAYETWRASWGETPVTLLKLDIEGMELAALAGARCLLERHHPQIVVELGTPEARAAVRAFLGEFGYRDIGRRFCWSPTYHFVDPRVHTLRPDPGRPPRDREADWLDRTSHELSDLVAEGERFVLVDGDQYWPGLVTDGRHRLPFLERNGQYWGPPPDDQTAIRELDRLRREGARFIIFVWPAFWWFDHYAELSRYLDTRGRRLVENERLVAFELG